MPALIDMDLLGHIVKGSMFGVNIVEGFICILIT